MLAPSNRLRAASDISRVYKRGSYGGSGGALSVKAATTGRSHSRAVIVVGKKISKKAVVRNRIRRRLQAQLRGFWATVLPGYDIVISVHADLAAAPVPALTDHLQKALSRAGVLTS